MLKRSERTQRKRLKRLKRLNGPGKVGIRIPAVIRGLRILALLSIFATSMFAGGAEAGEYRRLQVLVIVYTDTFAGTVTSSEVENIWKEVGESVEFIWRSSRMRVHLAVDRLTINRFVAQDQFVESKPGRFVLPSWTIGDAEGSVAMDLANLGYETNSYDVVVAFYAFDQTPERTNRFGAASYGVNKLLGKAAYIAIPMSWRPDSFNVYVEHEFIHILKSIYDASGYTGFPVNHNVKFFKFVNGEDASYEKWILADLSDAQYFDPSVIWGTVRSFKDRDGDRVPDYSPYGDNLTITEETLGSSTDHVDTDNDGLSDLEEAIAGVRGGTDPRNPDTDGDGLVDGSDPEPLKAPEADPLETSDPDSR